jgi:hypothetical protein
MKAPRVSDPGPQGFAINVNFGNLHFAPNPYLLFLANFQGLVDFSLSLVLLETNQRSIPYRLN